MHVIAPAPAGGSGRVVHALAMGQQRNGHHVVVVPIVEEWSPDHLFAGPLAFTGVEVRPVVATRRAYRRERVTVSALARAFAPEVMHTHGYHADVVNGGVGRRLGVATVSTAHGFTGGDWRNRFYEYLDRRALCRFDAVAAVSRPLADELSAAGVPRSRLFLIRNAWQSIGIAVGRKEARDVLGLPSDGFVVGWVGRMSPEKGLDVLIDAMPQMRDLPVRVCAVGDGSQRASLERRAHERGVSERIRWTGLVREAEHYFSAFDVVVVCSRAEGTPMVALEAMATGVPLVVTSVGGIPDMLSSHEAIMVPAEDPLALAAGIRQVIDHPQAAAERARAASIRLEEQFAEATWLASYEAMYSAALGGRR